MSGKHIKPPHRGSRFFGTFLLDEEINEKLGDFEEAFRYLAEERGVFRAGLWYWLQIFKTLPACLENIIYWRFIMIKSYLKIAFRNITKSKALSFINIFGLAIGIAFFILVFLFVKNEYSHDRFHENHDSVYRVISEHNSANKQSRGAFTPMRLADDLKRLYPEIEKTVRISRTTAIIRNNGNSFRETVHYVGKEFFTVFSFPVLQGNTSNPLADPHSIVISKKMAEKFFQNRDPIGKRLNIEFYDRKGDFYVSAVYDTKAGESSLVFDFIISFDNYLEKYQGKFMMTSYRANGGETYLKLQESTSAQNFDKKLAKIGAHINFGLPKGRSITYSIQPLKDIHLDNRFSNTISVVSNPVYSYILSGLGLLVLFIGCVNFLTLTLGRSASRAKEVGIRKVVGADKSHLAKQYLGEAILISVFALIVALLLASLMLPRFNELAGKTIAFKIDLSFLFGILAITLLVGTASGIYPAVVLSRFNPVKVLRGGGSIKGKNHFNRILVVAQFMLSIFLIITTLTMKKQLNYMTAMNLGFDHERLVEIAMNSSGEVSPQVLQRFKNEIAQNNNGMILGVSAAATPYGTFWTRVGVETVEKEQVKFYYNQVDYDYLKTMGIEIVKGRNFSKEYGSDSTEAVIVNETFVKQYGVKEPLHKSLPGAFKNRSKIIAVVKDFNFASLHDDIQPLVLALNYKTVAAKKFTTLHTPSWPPHLDYIIVRIGSGDLRPIMETLESTWREVSPGSPVKINFVDDTIDRNYQSEKRWGEIVNYASIFAIYIAAMGLFGLSMLSTEKRLKEIGIRKVLGAATGRLVVFITKDLLLLVAAANLFAWPVAFLAVNRWLQNFAFKIDISLSIFIFTAFLSLLIAGLTIGYQTLKAAFLNPIDIIRYE